MTSFRIEGQALSRQGSKDSGRLGGVRNYVEVVLFEWMTAKDKPGNGPTSIPMVVKCLYMCDLVSNRRASSVTARIERLRSTWWCAELCGSCIPDTRIPVITGLTI